jgi:acetyl-CoA carboxylase carboxyl transferase subunit alpha
MKIAAKFGLPVITLVDTAGAAADVGADERGISEAIARAMFEMASLPVPIISVIIGEGGSGGGLGLGLADRVLMLEHAYYSVITPEGCAAILWRDPSLASKAAEQLNLTAQRALELGVIDAIIPEPLGGAHREWEGAAQNLRAALACHLDQLLGTPPQALLAARYDKFRHMGRYVDDAEGEAA